MVQDSKNNVLGVVLAGGQSSRFGSDKAMASLHGIPLIEHAIEGLRCCRTIAVSGRDYGAYLRIDDRPSPGMGPLGALNGALHKGLELGFERVLTVACDNAKVPANLIDMLGTGNAIVADQPVVGIWHCALAGRLDEWISAGNKRSMMAWVEAVDADVVELAEPPANVNRPEELLALSRTDWR